MTDHHNHSSLPIVVVGAGASGMMAAGRAAEQGADVLLLERTKHPGNKIMISGKKRCNVTNAKELHEFIAMFGPNGRFLYSAFHRYFRDDLLVFLKRYGVETKTERGGRVFPISDEAFQVVRALERYLADHGVRPRTGARVTGLQIENGRATGVQTDRGMYPAAAVILATGGASYPSTGSTGDGYRIAADIGHTIVGLRPALVPLVVHEVQVARSMQGVSLRNVRLTAYQCHADEIDSSLSPATDVGRGTVGRRPRPPVIESRAGEMLITHYGLSGPITLAMSLSVVDALEHGPVSVSIDLKPALSEEELRQRLRRDLEHHSKWSYRRFLKGLLPAKMIDPYVEMTGIPRDKPGHRISVEERERLLVSLKSLRFNIQDSLSLASAIVTAGGVSLNEIDPRTMASRVVSGLYFCGEVMDLDAETGGYNLQSAFSTGYVAGEHAAAYWRANSIPWGQ